EQTRRIRPRIVGTEIEHSYALENRAPIRPGGWGVGRRRRRGQIDGVVRMLAWTRRAMTYRWWARRDHGGRSHLLDPSEHRVVHGDDHAIVAGLLGVEHLARPQVLDTANIRLEEGFNPVVTRLGPEDSRQLVEQQLLLLRRERHTDVH